MKTTLPQISLSFTTLAVALAASPIYANHQSTYHQVEILAIRTQNQAREMAAFIRYNRHLPPCSQNLQGELAAIGETATCIRQTADQFGNPQHLARDVRELSQLVAHVSRHVRDLPTGGWGSSGATQASVRNLNRIMLCLQDHARELQAKVLLLDDACFFGNGSPSGPGQLGYNQYGSGQFGGGFPGQSWGAAPIQQRPGYSYGSGGLTFGNSQFSIRLGR